jgi:hypothetical protein
MEGEEPAESNSLATTPEQPASVSVISRPKRERTPGQIASFEKATQALKAKVAVRRAEKKKLRAEVMIDKIRARYSLDAPAPSAPPDSPAPPAVPAPPGPITAQAPEPPRARVRRRPRSTPPPEPEPEPEQPNPYPVYPTLMGVGVRRHVFKFY